MSRFINPFPQYLDSSGSPISGGFLKFFESGSTSTTKNVFSDANFAIDIGNEIRLDSAGRVTAIFLDGAYRVVLTDSSGNQIRDADPIGVDTPTTAFEIWVVSNTYALNDIVIGSDDFYYQSLSNSNNGNNPTSTTGFWNRIYFVGIWDDARTYSIGEMVIGSDGLNYSSAIDANLNNDPISSAGTIWRRILNSDEALETDTLNISKADVEFAGINFLNDNIRRWAINFDTDETLEFNAYNASGVLDSTFMNFNFTTGIAIDANVAITGDFDLTGAFSFTGDLSTTGNLTVTNGLILFTQDGAAAGQEVRLTSDAAQQSVIAFQDATVDRWIIGQNTGNDFQISRFNASGVFQDTPFLIEDGSADINFSGHLNFSASDLGIQMTLAAGGQIEFDWPNVTTGAAIVEFFQNTTTTGDRRLSVYRGDGSNDVTLRLDAEDGSIFPALDRAGTGEQGVKLGKITLSTAAPTGGEDGDLWLRFE